jgi:hypothetical protein
VPPAAGAPPCGRQPELKKRTNISEIVGFKNVEKCYVCDVGKILVKNIEKYCFDIFESV